jgi:16S rRNA (adenine1518-N6/adenine1519-N6)-dimethyltransferase
MNLSEMRECLAREGIELTKSLGQNFLHDANQLRRIVEAAELTEQDRVLEIGPGLGPLTELLRERAGEVLAIEKDARLVALLRARWSGDRPTSHSSDPRGLTPRRCSALRLLHEDALAYLKRERSDWSDWKLVSNLPYSVASPILVELAQGQRAPQRMVATLQREVARRLAAGADDEDYGVLTLLVQLDFEPRGGFRIPASCFFPEPDVDSACVILVRRPRPLLPEAQRGTFVKIVKRAFSQRRKMMLKLLKEDWPMELLEPAFAGLKISPRERAEKLSLEQFIALTGHLHPQPAAPGTIASEEILDVVNERDEVVDRQPRGEVHRLGLRHRAVHVLVFNDRGQIFLQKRSRNKDRQPGRWDSSASGHVDSGEAYAAAAVRELREEIGLAPAPRLTRLFELDACAETDQEFVRVYRGETAGPLTLNPDEIERGDWFAPEEVTRWMTERPRDFADAFRLIWRKWGGGVME